MSGNMTHDTSSEATSSKDLNTSDSPMPKDEELSFLTLPLEIRQDIYEHLLPHSPEKTKQRAGRKCIRLDWTSAARNSYGGLADIAPLAATCRDIRKEIIPTFFAGIIVKFPAWNEDFKRQCLYWVGHVSETALRSIDCFWLEGVYWRLCVRLGKAADRDWEEVDARNSDWRKFSDHVFFKGDGYSLRVESFDHCRAKAEEAGRKMEGMIASTLAGRERKELERSELSHLIDEASLSGRDWGRRWTGNGWVLNNLHQIVQ